jgi:hypothetical protein
MQLKELNNQGQAIKSFWKQDGRDYIADLGNMTKAIVVCYYTPIIGVPYYAISPRSYFPFTDEQNKRRFNNAHTCCLWAEDLVLDWMKSLIIGFPKSDSDLVSDLCSSSGLPFVNVDKIE